MKKSGEKKKSRKNQKNLCSRLHGNSILGNRNEQPFHSVLINNNSNKWQSVYWRNSFGILMCRIDGFFMENSISHYKGNHYEWRFIIEKIFLRKSIVNSILHSFSEWKKKTLLVVFNAYTYGNILNLHKIDGSNNSNNN